MDNLAPCSHEEADTRLMLHALDARLTGHRRIKIKTNDTDVVVLAISVAHEIQADELWLEYGSGKTLRFLPIHSIAQSLAREKSEALPLFHALTGCDSVIFCWTWKENGVGCMESVSWSNRSHQCIINRITLHQ